MLLLLKNLDDYIVLFLKTQLEKKTEERETPSRCDFVTNKGCGPFVD